MVKKIAIPPPNGIIELWNLSSAGLATKSVRIEILLIRPVRDTDKPNEPHNRQIANIANVEIVHTPVLIDY